MSRGSENPSTNLALTPALDVPSLPAGHHDHRTLRRLPPLQSIYMQLTRGRRSPPLTTTADGVTAHTPRCSAFLNLGAVTADGYMCAAL